MDRVAPTTRARMGLALMCIACLAGGACSREPTTPEAKRQRGDEIVRRMSDHLAQARTFAVETTDVRTRARGGKEITVRTTRRMTLRRPDRLALNVSGDTDLRGWYDGSKLTFVSDPQKVWARVNGAPTIDDTLDRLADHLAMPMPMADFLLQLAVRVADRHEVQRRLRRPRDDRRRALPPRRLHAPRGRLGSLGRRTGRSAAEEVPHHQQDLHSAEDDGGHVRQVDVRRRRARRDLRGRRAGGLRAHPGRGGQAADDESASSHIRARGKLAERVAGQESREVVMTATPATGTGPAPRLRRV